MVFSIELRNVNLFNALFCIFFSPEVQMDTGLARFANTEKIYMLNNYNILKAMETRDCPRYAGAKVIDFFLTIFSKFL